MITKEELLEETYGTLELLKELKSGLLVYNKSHFKKNFIDISNDIDEIKRKIKNGWELRPGKYKFFLRAPEVVLCDLSEVHTNPTCDLREILTLFRILNHLNREELITKISSKYFPGLEVVLLEGEFSNLEIRMAGSDKRVYDFPKILYRILKKSKLWKTEFLKVKNTLKNRKVKIKNINKCNCKAKNFYRKLVKKYSVLGEINLPDIAVYGFWESIPQNDIYLFVPKAGIKYALGFIEEKEQTQNIMLWECHLSLDVTKELKIFAKELKNKKVAIIDRSYSSNSLDYLEKKVMREGGQPLKIALFPKSKRAIQRSDYILFLDKVIPSKNIQFKKNWAEDLFIKIVNEY